MASTWQFDGRPIFIHQCPRCGIIFENNLQDERCDRHRPRFKPLTLDDVWDQWRNRKPQTGVATTPPPPGYGGDAHA